ncbi:CO or xanthine dehydrogenase, FAD-binding subunit [Anaerovirgula multivorans]|uniref:CO or xanthine dehydrogenase, FAD-binding subunit n=1 Tax=Anaerovirgula multivorans TaxID=312168 RepID=A0A239IT94_9FIRM|nr:FAD binding domain-containing protein [Anaerovirgula multivorans]SNS96811.1 CO or xanthine dehydrogenase, FAD-binding subunit [Anaerovirgula multivorans]
MIPFDFDYYRPDSIQEAVKIYEELDTQGKQPLYYGGGTEIITMARTHNIFTKALVDLKGIPECNVLEFRNDQLVIGSTVTLTQIFESRKFPLLGDIGSRIADHTAQCQITLGGNIAGTIIYRETVLPLLLSSSQIVIANESGQKQVSLHEVFNERLQLNPGEFIVQVITDKIYTTLPYVHVKKTKYEKIDYPLMTVVAVKKDEKIRIAFSGLCSFPFRSMKMENALNENSQLDVRINNALSHLPTSILNDISGSDKYREFVLRDTLINTLKTLEGVGLC